MDPLGPVDCRAGPLGKGFVDHRGHHIPSDICSKNDIQTHLAKTCRSKHYSHARSLAVNSQSLYLLDSQITMFGHFCWVTHINWVWSEPVVSQAAALWGFLAHNNHKLLYIYFSKSLFFGSTKTVYNCDVERKILFLQNKNSKWKTRICTESLWTNTL